MSESEKKEAGHGENETVTRGEFVEGVKKDEMSESEKKEAGHGEFVEAVKKDGDEGLKKGFQVLSKGEPMAHVDEEDLKRALLARKGPEFSIQDLKLKTSIQALTRDGECDCQNFIRIIKLLEEPAEADLKNKIYEKLKKAGKSEDIVLLGEEGVGKTWMAREVANLARRNDDFDFVIWLFLNRMYEGLSLHESIAYQVSVLAKFEKSEAEKKKNEEEDKQKKKKKEKKKDRDEATKRREMMMRLINEAIKGKKLLLILDSNDSIMKAIVKREGEKAVLELRPSGGGAEMLVELENLESCKLLITTRVGYEAEAKDENVITVRFTWEASKAMVNQALKREDIKDDKVTEEAQELAHYFMLKSERLPARLLLISRIVSHFASKGEEGLQKLRDDREAVKNGENVWDVLIKGYTKIPKGVLIDGYSKETPEEHFFRQGRKVNFNALICYWIMEGHLGHFDRIEDAYMEGHRVLMELMDCGLLLKKDDVPHEADYVVACGATRFNLHINDYKDFFSGVRPGLAVTFDMRLGPVALADGMIKTVGNRNSQIISTLLLDGNRVSQEESPLKSLSEHKDEVEVLAINEPTIQHFDLPILEMRKLRLLALRGCQFLDNLDRFLPEKSDQQEPKKPEVNLGPSVAVEKPDTKPEDHSRHMEGLVVLEISGPSSIKTIPDGMFDLMPNLKTVNLSNLLEVQSLPACFYQLTQIEFLILRGCKSLTELKSIKNFKELKVLDVSNSISFEKFEDKSLHTNGKLKILNLSNTKLKTLPLINQLKDLKFVWLSGCAELPRIRKIDRLENLQILDIAGAQQVERFCDPSLEDLHSLLILDISRTAIKRLPANIGDPTYLFANNCSKIRVVPPVEGLQKLQVLHFSGCDRLGQIRQEFFEKVKGLRELDLSKTKVKNLPFLSTLISLRRLVLSKCELLHELHELSNLKELEYLDLSGCKALTKLEDETFDHMIHLQFLDLSQTGLGGGQKLPSLSQLKSLKQLHVRDCANLTELPGLEEVPKLEVLDYSGTVLKSTPHFNKCQPQVIGAGIESINTKELFGNLGVEWPDNVEDKKLDFEYGEVSLCKWNISRWIMGDAEKSGKPVYGVHFLRLLKEYPSFLEENLRSFHLLVHPSETRLHDDFKASYIDELSLRDIYFKQVCKEKIERSLEIRGFNNSPIPATDHPAGPSLETLIERPQFVVLVDDPFLRSLLYLGTNRTMAMKACWIESCKELKYVVDGPEKETKKPEETTKTGGVDQKKVDTGKLQELVKGEGDQHKAAAAEKAEESTKNDAAAAAETTKGQDDQQKNPVDEKSGEAAKTEGDAAEHKSGEPEKSEKKDGGDKLGESEKSHSNQPENEKKSEELPKSEGDKQKDGGEEQKNAEKSEADGQKNDADSGNTDELKNQAKNLNRLETLWISDASNLESILQSEIQSFSFESLKSLYLEYCPNLSSLTSSAHLPSLETLHIKYCKNLNRLFTDENSPRLDNLQNLQLWGLDSLKKIDCKAPLLQTLRVGQCPLIEHVIASRLKEEDKRYENEGHDNLEVLHIKSCNNLKSICESSIEEHVQLEKLTHLELSVLPELKKVARASPVLRVLRVNDCPNLESIVGGGDGVRDLETVEVRSCERLRKIIDGGESELIGITKIELLGLPKLESIGAQLPRSITGIQLDVRACPKLNL